MSHPVEITHIYVADGHCFFKAKEKDPDRFPASDLDEVEVVQDSGLRGDRFFKHDPEFGAHVTFFQQEVHDELVKTFARPDLKADRYRRNICVRGFDIHSLVGKEFTIGGIRFRGTEIAQPCKWMEVSVHPGAKQFLKDRGGLRAHPLSSGTLRKGESRLELAAAQVETAAVDL